MHTFNSLRIPRLWLFNRTEKHFVKSQSISTVLFYDSNSGFTTIGFRLLPIFFLFPTQNIFSRVRGVKFSGSEAGVEIWTLYGQGFLTWVYQMFTGSTGGKKEGKFREDTFSKPLLGAHIFFGGLYSWETHMFLGGFVWIPRCDTSFGGGSRGEPLFFQIVSPPRQKRGRGETRGKKMAQKRVGEHKKGRHMKEPRCVGTPRNLQRAVGL